MSDNKTYAGSPVKKDGWQYQLHTPLSLTERVMLPLLAQGHSVSHAIDMAGVNVNTGKNAVTKLKNRGLIQPVWALTPDGKKAMSKMNGAAE